MRIFAPTQTRLDIATDTARSGRRPTTTQLELDGVRAIEQGWQPRPGHRYRGGRLVIKRVFDVLAAVILLVLLAPLLLATLLAIRLTSTGPALFRQDRVGQAGRRFRIVKFRSMHIDAEQRLHSDEELRTRYLSEGYKLPVHDDPRITRLGGILRKTSIDELPQLWNVVKGDMSLVGPRPVLPDELAEYRGYMDAYLMAKPGLSGRWQVAGRDAVRFPHRARLDAEYIDGWSLTKDAEILLRTLPAAARARGVR